MDIALRRPGLELWWFSLRSRAQASNGPVPIPLVPLFMRNIKTALIRKIRAVCMPKLNQFPRTQFGGWLARKNIFFQAVVWSPLAVNSALMTPEPSAVKVPALIQV